MYIGSIVQGVSQVLTGTVTSGSRMLRIMEVSLEGITRVLTVTVTSRSRMPCVMEVSLEGVIRQI